jgi:very-short-patch-repair endonuclease
MSYNNGTCSRCGQELTGHSKNKTGLCLDCWRKGRTEQAQETAAKKRCEDCGKQIAPKSTICRDCYSKRRSAMRPKCVNCGKLLKQQSTERCKPCWLTELSRVGQTPRMAAGRATAMKNRIKRSKAEEQCAELLELLDWEYQEQVVFDRWIVDFVIDRLVIEVHGSYWHDRPAAIERDQAKKAYLESQGYEVVFLRTDQMHLWWKLLGFQLTKLRQAA